MILTLEIIRQGYIGNPAQLVTLRRVTMSEGRAKGTEIIEVKTAGGLELDLVHCIKVQSFSSLPARTPTYC